MHKNGSVFNIKHIIFENSHDYSQNYLLDGKLPTHITEIWLINIHNKFNFPFSLEKLKICDSPHYLNTAKIPFNCNVEFID
jgi:hypothetical protein